MSVPSDTGSETTWTGDELRRIGEATEIELVMPRGRVPIWVVRAGDQCSPAAAGPVADIVVRAKDAIVAACLVSRVGFRAGIRAVAGALQAAGSRFIRADNGCSHAAAFPVADIVVSA